jgi:hypothetical protein
MPKRSRSRKLSDSWILFVAFSDRGMLALHRGDPATARACFEA